MRKSTQAFLGVVSLGLVAAGYQAGLAAEVSNGFSAAAPAELTSAAPASNATPTSAAAASPSAESPSPVETPVSSTSTAPAPAPASTPKTTVPAPVSTPKAPAQAPAAPAPSGNSSTKTGAAVQYRYGVIQVSVTKSNGKVTGVDLIQQGATGGRQAAFTYLVDLAIQANGTSFGNLSGATFTVDAFKQSMESALAKF
ncbi:MAG: hypothetical protein RJA66_610 [Actinomycetota bacterium]